MEVGGRRRVVEIVRAEGGRFLVAVDGRISAVRAADVDGRSLSLLFDEPIGGRRSYEATIATDRSGRRIVHIGGAAVAIGRPRSAGDRTDRQDGPRAPGAQRVVAAMAGRVVRVLVAAGEAVRAGQGLVVIEAMKMQNELRATRDGTVTEICVGEAALVEAGALLVVVA